MTVFITFVLGCILGALIKIALILNEIKEILKEK